MVKLLVFLGNPGKEYEKTRHNVGWIVCSHAYGTVSWTEKFHGLIAQAEGRRLLKPGTYMNESGRSVRACMDFYGIAPEEVLVVHDDLELPFGTVRLQSGGGLQGHNGLKSIKQHAGSDDFLRLRIGIGRPARESVASYVLQRFTKEEESQLSFILDAARNLLLDTFNQLPVTQKVL